MINVQLSCLVSYLARIVMRLGNTRLGHIHRIYSIPRRPIKHVNAAQRCNIYRLLNPIPACNAVEGIYAINLDL